MFENCVDGSIQRLKKYVVKSKVRSITTTSNRNKSKQKFKNLEDKNREKNHDLATLNDQLKT